jgi:hypothetical protein
MIDEPIKDKTEVTLGMIKKALKAVFDGSRISLNFSWDAIRIYVLTDSMDGMRNFLPDNKRATLRFWRDRVGWVDMRGGR